MLVSQSKIDQFLTQWATASKAELRARLQTLKTKSNTATVMAEQKAIQALLA